MTDDAPGPTPPSPAFWTSPAWRAFQRELTLSGAVDVELTLRRLLELLAQLVHAQNGFVVLARRSEENPGVHDGWLPERVILLEHGAPTTEALVDEWMRSPERVRQDPFTMALIESCGAPRCLLRADCLGDAPWHEQPSYRLLSAMGGIDRMVGGTPLSDDLELFVGLIRAAAQRDFDLTDKLQLLLAMEFLAPVGRNLALSHGLVRGTQPLAPRERQVLNELLAGASESDIAETTALSEHTVHDYVKRIYRKYGAQSRAELMALWLTSWR